MKDINYEEFNYRDELRIDDLNLDEEWAIQPQLFMKYAEACAQAKLDFDDAKGALDVVRAEVDLAVRDDPSMYTGSDKKPTETQISNIITTEKQYKDAYKAQNIARHKYEIMLGAVRAFDQRKSTLENLVRLHGQNYFSSPSETIETTPVVGSMRSNKLKDKVKNKMKNKQ